MKPTPGTWSCNEYGFIESPDDHTGHPVEICRMPKGDSYSGAVGRENWKANSRLLAAAPDLLDALKMAISNIPRPSMTDRDAAERAATLVYLQNIINRAEGE